MRKHKRKSKRKPRRYVRRAAIVCAAMLVFVLCFLFVAYAVISQLSLALYSAWSPAYNASQVRNVENTDYRYVDTGRPRVVETITVPLNADVPVYTENEFTEWVTVTVSGSVERDGESLHGWAIPLQ